MKFSVKKLLVTVFAASASLGLGVAGTLAYFTSVDKASVSVESGQIKVDAALSIESIYSLDKPMTLPSFENGGTASVTGQVLTLDRITPGDKVVGKLSITNSSNVKTKYRVNVDVDEKDYVLASGLVFTLYSDSSTAISKPALSSYRSAWTYVDTSTSSPDVKEIEFTIELPKEAGNIYQGKKCDYKISVEAVQYNSTDGGDEVYCYIEAEAEDLGAGDITMSTDPATGEPISILANDKSVTASMPSSTTDSINVSVPSGVKLNNGTTALTLAVSESNNDTNFTFVGDGEEVNASYNIMVDGLASDNDEYVTVTLPYSSTASLSKIAHVKDDGSIEYILPYSATNPNGFIYGGGSLIFKTKSFSEFALINLTEYIYITNNMNWNPIYIYMWKNGGGSNASWPGVQLTNVAAQNELDQDIYLVDPRGYDKFIVSTKGEQTVDVEITTGSRYWIDGSKTDNKYNVGSTTDKLIYFSKGPGCNWSNVYVYLWNNNGGYGNQNADFPGKQIDSHAASATQYGSNIYAVAPGNYSKVIFSNGSGDQTVDMAVTNGYHYITEDKDGSGHYNCSSAEYSFSTVYKAVESGDTITLHNDIDINEPFRISKSTTFDLNGFNISYSGTTKNIFTIEKGATLTITDSSNRVQYGLWDEDGYSLTSTPRNGATQFTGGVIYGGRGVPLNPDHSIHDPHSGGAFINYGTLIIDGANIAGNSVTGNAGAINNMGGTVTLKSGKICDNKASVGSGGAIYNTFDEENRRATFNMQGGEISGNDAYRAVIVVRGSTFNFSGGTISNNTVHQYMIDISTHSDTLIGEVTMSGGTISYNTCSSAGGAFHVRGGSRFTMTGGEITQNTCAGGVGVNRSDTKTYYAVW